MKKPSVGGQAVIEGVMMRNADTYATAIRKPDKTIYIDKKEYKSKTIKYKILGLPLIRGVVSFAESMVIGTKILMKSAEFFEVDAEETKFDKWINEKFGEKADNIIVALSVIIAFIMAMGLFVLLPLGLSQLLKDIVPESWMINLADGIIRVIVLLVYVFAISKMDDVKRVLMYHGAEHKSIHCFESEEELNVENAKKQTRFHKRCGTSFLLYIVVISVFLFTIVNPQTLLTRFLTRICLLPVIAGISYEVLKAIGKSESKVLNVFAKPGLWLQKLTTKEPTDDMLEVAITALKSSLTKEQLNELEQKVG